MGGGERGGRGQARKEEESLQRQAGSWPEDSISRTNDADSKRLHERLFSGAEISSAESIASHLNPSPHPPTPKLCPFTQHISHRRLFCDTAA